MWYGLKQTPLGSGRGLGSEGDGSHVRDSTLHLPLSLREGIDNALSLSPGSRGTQAKIKHRSFAMFKTSTHRSHSTVRNYS